jgi:hypothetical protein
MVVHVSYRVDVVGGELAAGWSSWGIVPGRRRGRVLAT